jgi:hypothetical protein
MVVMAHLATPQAAEIALGPDWCGLLKAELKRRNMTYADLGGMLKRIGVKEDEHNLRNKVAAFRRLASRIFRWTKYQHIYPWRVLQASVQASVSGWLEELHAYRQDLWKRRTTEHTQFPQDPTIGSHHRIKKVSKPCFSANFYTLAWISPSNTPPMAKAPRMAKAKVEIRRVNLR